MKPGVIASLTGMVVVAGSILGAGDRAPEPKVAALPVMGACCLPDGTCLMMYHPDCTEHGGNWFGPNVHCEDVDCRPRPCPSDLDGNGAVDPTDLLLLIGCIEHGRCPAGVDADLNRDGRVDDGDLAEMIDVLLSGVC